MYDAAVDAGFAPPESTIPPECPDHLLNYLQIFWTLSSCRSMGGMGGAGPIPWTAIDKYAERYEIVDDELLYDDLMFYINAMDQTYLQIMKEEMERQNSSSQSNNSPGKGLNSSEW